MSKNLIPTKLRSGDEVIVIAGKDIGKKGTLREIVRSKNKACLLYTSPSPRDSCASRMPSSA